MKKHFKDNVEGSGLTAKLDEITNEKAGAVQEIFWNHHNGTYNIIWYIQGREEKSVISSDMSTAAIAEYKTETVWPAWYQEEKVKAERYFVEDDDAYPFVKFVEAEGGVVTGITSRKWGQNTETVVAYEVGQADWDEYYAKEGAWVEENT